MNETEVKLAHCFSLAFPKMEASRYSSANVENTAEWDSVAQVTLLTVIGEEFGIDIDFEEFEGATSFDALAKRIAQLESSQS